MNILPYIHNTCSNINPLKAAAIFVFTIKDKKRGVSKRYHRKIFPGIPPSENAMDIVREIEDMDCVIINMAEAG